MALQNSLTYENKVKEYFCGNTWIKRCSLLVGSMKLVTNILWGIKLFKISSVPLWWPIVWALQLKCCCVTCTLCDKLGKTVLDKVCQKTRHFVIVYPRERRNGFQTAFNSLSLRWNRNPESGGNLSSHETFQLVFHLHKEHKQPPQHHILINGIFASLNIHKYLMGSA